MDGQDPLSLWRHSLDGTFYLTRELAESLGVSTDSIRARCSSNPALAPRRIGVYAGRDVWLFTPEEAESLRADFERRPAKPGRPRLWSDVERADRHRRRIAQSYWARTAELAHFQGQIDKARRAERKAADIARGLRVQRPGAPSQH